MSNSSSIQSKLAMSPVKSTPAPVLCKRELTRIRVITAAIDCISKEGFSAAHTNRIAERADVSWGVLQYHFGDKDSLLQAVLDYIFDDFTSSIREAQINHKQLRDRVSKLIEVVWQQVSKPGYRVSIAILSNAGCNTDSTIDKSRIVDIWSREIGALWRRIIDDLTETPGKSETAKRLMFATLRGFADDLNPPERRTTESLTGELDALADSLTYLLNQ
ncbi:MAG: TetR/AcrR family transcriptional regulator [Halieaceae bacterium]|jgi:TetR/AcrR family transcriptional regulator, regulator of cefoperazone and chloramphenicol sensitivity|nr:TetR/AcrR family transcriptional regulator [Halieaceae bacterium]